MEISRLTGGRFETSLPLISTAPDVGVSRPAMRRRVVDLPQPEGPRRTRSVPSSQPKLILLKARKLPQLLEISLKKIADMFYSLSQVNLGYRGKKLLNA